MITDARFPGQAEVVRKLFSEYAESIGVDIEYQGFSAELESLPGEYGPPYGALLLAEESDEYVGCVALRKLEDGICEMKRLYVSPTGRGKGVGRQLTEAIIVRASELGYEKMRLDTLRTMAEARQLYKRLGFVSTEPYCYNPLPGAEFYELEL